MSRLLIDENLPFSLVRLLSMDCVHASESAAQASDTLCPEKAALQRGEPYNVIY